MGSTLVAFVGGAEGPWHVERLDAVTGPALPRVDHLSVVADPTAAGSFADATWILRGAVSYERYVRRTEHDQLAASEAFEQLVNRLRQTEEWTYVEREVDIRLVRTGC